MKATVSVFALTTWLPLTVPDPVAGILDQVGKTERKTFPRSEAMEFENELQKRNFELIVIVDDALQTAHPALVGYVAFTRVKGTALLHKVCVLERYRCQGIASKALQMHFQKLSAQGCRTVQLWVDMLRKPGKQLYCKLGFAEVQVVEDYYAAGRTGVKMELQLD